MRSEHTEPDYLVAPECYDEGADEAFSLLAYLAHLAGVRAADLRLNDGAIVPVLTPQDEEQQ